MKKFYSPKVGGGKTLIGKNSIDFYKRWFRELFIPLVFHSPLF